MQPDDLALLESARTAPRVPFRDPVRVAGQLMPRRLARQIERGFSRLSVSSARDDGRSELADRAKAPGTDSACAPVIEPPGVATCAGDTRGGALPLLPLGAPARLGFDVPHSVANTERSIHNHGA